MNEHLTPEKLVKIMTSHKEKPRSPFIDENLQLNQQHILSDIDSVISSSASCTSTGNHQCICVFACNAFCLQEYPNICIQRVVMTSHGVLHANIVVLKSAPKLDTCLVERPINRLALCHHDAKLGVWVFASLNLEAVSVLSKHHHPLVPIVPCFLFVLIEFQNRLGHHFSLK